MKFKQTGVVEQTIPSMESLSDSIEDICVIDFTELESMESIISDCQILYSNIEKYGITDPVMDLVGGTLQEWNINITDKDKCLEDLAERIKEGARKIWEFIVRIYEKIRDWVNEQLVKFNRERLINLKKKLSGKRLDQYTDATGLIPSKYVNSIIQLGNTKVSSVTTSVWGFLKGLNAVIKLGTIDQNAGTLELDQKFIDACDDIKLSVKGYSSIDNVLDDSIRMIDAYGGLIKFSNECVAYAKKVASSANVKDNDEAESFKLVSKLISKLMPYIAKSVRSASRIAVKLDKATN